MSLNGIVKLDLDDGDKIMELQDLADFSTDRTLLLHLIVDPATQENKKITECVLCHLFNEVIYLMSGISIGNFEEQK